MSVEPFEPLREQMIAEIAAGAAAVSERIGKAVFDERVMSALAKVPRHEFVPFELQPYAYANIPLPIGCDKTISQPFIVALMTDLLNLGTDDKVLEIGTPVLAELVRKVYSVEMIEELAQHARRRLRQQGYANVHIRVANGYHGWAEHAPFDKIIVTAAPDLIPPPLIHQLKPGGRMAIPSGLPDAQQLLLVEKDPSGRISTKEILAVRFSQLDGAELR